MNRRMERMGELFKKEISIRLQNDIRDPRIGFVTVSRVDITDDLSLARVRVSVFGSDKEKRDSLIGLNHSAGRLRSLLSKDIKIRRLPKLEFVLDENLDHGFRVQEILQELQGETRSGSAKNAQESPAETPEDSDESL
jgi:ribosome-binding factor A